MAACGILGVCAFSNIETNNLLVTTMPELGCSHLKVLSTFGVHRVDVPVQFNFQVSGLRWSGYLAFMGPPTCRRLLVTDSGNGAVHIIDVAGRAHAGFVAAPGTLPGCRGVAARENLVAVSSSLAPRENGGVHLYEGSGATWTPIRSIVGGVEFPGMTDCFLHTPVGLRFTSDGTKLAVTDDRIGCVKIFRVDDLSCVQNLPGRYLMPSDVEECEGGWFVACYKLMGCSLTYGDSGFGPTVRERDFVGTVVYGATSLALVPGLGLIVYEAGARKVKLFATHDFIAMSAMSADRMGWMVAVARGIAARGRATSGRAKMTKE